MEVVYINFNLIQKKLLSMSEWHQLAFGAVCCERMFPYYKQFYENSGWGDVQVIRESIDMAWSTMSGSKPSVKLIQRSERSCFEVISDSDDFGELDGSLAQRAGIGVCYLLKFLQRSDVNYILEIANVSMECAYFIAMLRDNKHISETENEENILHHELMQTEINRQAMELRIIGKVEKLNSGLIYKIRNGVF